MNKHLYFICPTDHLETVIAKRFKQENFYYTSLGNSVTFDVDQVGEISELIYVNQIKQVTFVLSDNNRMVQDAIKNQDFSGVNGLSNFYDEIARQMSHSSIVWQSDNLRIPILKHYLNNKLKELESKLSHWLADQVIMDAKIYITQQDIFSHVNTELIPLESHSLN